MATDANPTDANPYDAPSAYPAQPLEHLAPKRVSILLRLALMGLCFLAVTYLIAYPGSWAKPPVGTGELLAMIPIAPIAMFCGVFLQSWGNPVVVGQVLGIPLILGVLVVIAMYFRDDLKKQAVAAAFLGLVNGLAARIVFFIAHSLST